MAKNEQKNGEKSPRKWRQKTAKKRLKKEGKNGQIFTNFRLKKTAHFPRKITSKSAQKNEQITAPKPGKSDTRKKQPNQFY